MITDQQLKNVQDLCASVGMEVPESITDGKNRFGKGGASYVCCTLLSDNTLMGRLGDWSDHDNTMRNFSFNPSGDWSEPTEPMKRDFETKYKETKEQGYGYAEQIAARLIKHGKPHPDHPYLKAKCIGMYGSVVDIRNNDLLVPIYYRKKLVNVQRIITDESGSFSKRFLGGGRINGCYCVVHDDVNNTEDLTVTEGFATGASIHIADGGNVIAALSAGNMEKLADEIGYKHISEDTKRVSICADNDINSIGVRSAKKMVNRLKEHGILSMITVPTMTGSDFNDIHVEKGIDNVREMLAGLVVKKHSDLMTTISQKYIINGLIPLREVGIMYGPSQIGKSLIALDLGMRVMDGQYTEWMGLKIDRHCKFIYFSNEDAGADHIRYRAWFEGNNADINKGSDIEIVNQALSLSDENDINTLKNFLVRRKGIKLVVLDTLAVYGGIEDENSNSEGKALMIRIRNEICIPFDTTVILVGHKGKSENSHGMRGASSYKDNAQFVIKVGHSAELDSNYCTVAKAKNCPKGVKYLYHIEGVDTGLVYKDGDSIQAPCAIWDGAHEKKPSGRPKNDVQPLDVAIAMVLDCQSNIVTDRTLGEKTLTIERNRLIAKADTMGVKHASKRFSGTKARYIKSLIDDGYVISNKKEIKFTEKLLELAGVDCSVKKI